MPPTQEAARITRNKFVAPKPCGENGGLILAERQWGTVREDYSKDGNAWDYFTHDQARSRSLSMPEDGLAGISDDRQLLCWCVAPCGTARTPFSRNVYSG